MRIDNASGNGGDAKVLEKCLTDLREIWHDYAKWVSDC